MARRKMATQTPQQIAQKWMQNYGASKQAILAGVAAAPDPTTAATQSGVMAAMRANWLSSIDNTGPGGWKAALLAAGKTGWADGMTKKTAQNLGTSAAAGAPHVASFMAQWQTFINNAVQSLNQSNPRGDYQANKARAAAMMDYMHGVKGKYRKLWRGGGGL